MQPHSAVAFDKWSAFYRRAEQEGVALSWPSETLVRLLKGSYIPGLPDLSGSAVLDVGFGNANNTVMLACLGARVSGIEIDQAICDLARGKLAALGLAADLRVGTNLSIPFDAESFDLLISWNVLHYTDNEQDFRAGIAEYARVLKPGGRIIVSTTGPDHKILEGAKPLGDHRYRIVTDPLRAGQVFYYVDSEENARRLFDDCFTDVHVGRIRDHLFTQTLDWFLITGVTSS